MRTGTPKASRSRGRSRRKSWSCRLLVAVLISARRPDSKQRHQVGEGLADAGAGLDHQRLAPSMASATAAAIASCASRGRIARVAARQRAVGSEGTRRPPPAQVIAHAGSGRFKRSISQAGDLVAQQQAALLQAPQRQLVERGGRARCGRSGCRDRRVPCAIRSAGAAANAGSRLIAARLRVGLASLYSRGWPKSPWPSASVQPPGCTAATAPTSRTRWSSSGMRAAQGAVLAVVADGMGGKSGGRKAADQVLLTARQIFERFAPGARRRRRTCCASWCWRRT